MAFLSILALTTSALVAFIFAVIIAVVYEYFFTAFPSSISRVRNEGKRRFDWATRMSLYTDCERLYQEAYETYSKAGRTCITPFVGVAEQVALPTRSLSWLARQPMDVLSPWEAFAELNKGHYTVQNIECFTNPWQGMIVKTQMNSVLEKLATSILGELKIAFETRFGSVGEEWTTLNVHANFRMVLAQLSSAFSVGAPLCRNEEYLKDAVNFGDLSTTSAFFISLLPSILRPLLAPFICLPIRALERRTAKSLAPVLASRLAKLQSGKPDPHEPQDRLQMMLRYAATDSPDELNAKDMTGRLITANVAAMHFASYAVSNTILNIVASDAEYSTLRILRDEIKDVLERNGGKWSKTTVAQMVHTDSVIRETLRVHGFLSRIVRIVTKKDGLVTEDGVFLPRGTVVTILTRAAHLDPENYPNPKHFDPFRFSRSSHLNAANEIIPCVATSSSSQSLVSLSSTNLAFGTGKHACPGRFLVDFEVKMIVAYLLVNYDVRLAQEHGGVRPENVVRGEAMVPNPGAKIEMRRRKGCGEVMFRADDNGR